MFIISRLTSYAVKFVDGFSVIISHRNETQHTQGEFTEWHCRGRFQTHYDGFLPEGILQYFKVSNTC